MKELPDNLDVKMALAETYEDLDEKEKALEIVNEGNLVVKFKLELITLMLINT